MVNFHTLPAEEDCDCGYCVATKELVELTVKLAKQGIHPDVITLAVLKGGLILTEDVPIVSKMIKAVGVIYIEEKEMMQHKRKAKK